MPTSWTAEGDFEEVVDTLEPLTLRRQGRHDPEWTRLCWRFSEVTEDPATVSGLLRRTDTVWQLTLVVGEVPPRPGDLLVDVGGRCMSIKTAEPRQGATRYRCEARHVELAPESAQRFDFQEPIFDDGPEGPTLVGYRTVRPGVLAAIERTSEPVDPEENAPVTLLTTSDPGLRVGDRVLSHRGDLYDVTEVTTAGPDDGVFSTTLVETVES